MEAQIHNVSWPVNKWILSQHQFSQASYKGAYSDTLFGEVIIKDKSGGLGNMKSGKIAN